MVVVGFPYVAEAATSNELLLFTLADVKQQFALTLSPGRGGCLFVSAEATYELNVWPEPVERAQYGSITFSFIS